jgi:valine dehydrogenase (NAD+)
MDDDGTPPLRTDPWLGFDGHERVVVAHDEATSTAMVIALHSTVLGPALGGTRMTAYLAAADPRAAAYADVLRLSRAMTYKNALAGLDHGGGKAVIVRDPSQPGAKSSDVLHAYGRLVASLGGAYVTAGDVGMGVADMDVIGEVCPWTTGRSEARGGVGDSGILTAVGVFEGLRAGTAFVFGSDSLEGRTVGVIGAGKVGGRLIGHLAEAGARVVAVDPSPEAHDRVEAQSPTVRWADSVDDLLAMELDILSPNALGGLLTPEVAARVSARLICGGANNQLADPAAATLLAERGIVYAPDFMVNCGGVIQVAEELRGGDLARARVDTERVYATTLRVLERAAAEGITPVAAAEREAEDRIRGARAEQVV